MIKVTITDKKKNLPRPPFVSSSSLSSPFFFSSFLGSTVFVFLVGVLAGCFGFDREGVLDSIPPDFDDVGFVDVLGDAVLEAGADPDPDAETVAAAFGLDAVVLAGGADVAGLVGAAAAGEVGLVVVTGAGFVAGADVGADLAAGVDVAVGVGDVAAGFVAVVAAGLAVVVVAVGVVAAVVEVVDAGGV